MSGRAPSCGATTPDGLGADSSQGRASYVPGPRPPCEVSEFGYDADESFDFREGRAMTAPASTVFTSLEEAPTAPMRYDRGTVASLFGLQTGAEHVDVHVNVLKPGSGPGPYHFHAKSDNVYFVLEGEISVVVEGEEYRLGPHDALFIPPGLRHATSNSGNTPARFIEIYAPASPDFHMADDKEGQN